ncbi:hypothetical protein [Luteipulveratus halotolerans]|uniref:Uncharacterized protein n=1 Tax=Luteipulveratus halotolerans TaxID=1631356 RepID=A0A0L6CJX2_9MICO|nr:hypothetical protein [Luteipulveratus halotolerans]KNX38096.1 hypothetical protein VV01_14630 [Luteipulveratus halotolerans]
MAAMKRTVIVRHPESLQAVALVEGTEVPEWAEGLVHVDDTDAPAEKPAARAAKKSPTGDQS